VGANLLAKAQTAKGTGKEGEGGYISACIDFRSAEFGLKIGN
jgi:hypothetical protein